MQSGKLIAATVLLSLAGCTTTRYIPISCLTKEQLAEREKAEPPMVKDRTVGMKADEALPIAVGSAIRLRSWGRGNLDVLRNCVG